MAQPPNTCAIIDILIDSNANSPYENQIVTSMPSVAMFEQNLGGPYFQTVSLTGPFPSAVITGGQWTLYLPWPSQIDSSGAPLLWEIFLPDGRAYAGVVPEGVVQTQLHDLVVAGWTPIQASSSAPVVPGAQGKQGKQGDPGQTGPPGSATGQLRDTGGYQYNIMAYGGVGDGVTANDAAWSAMLAAAANGGELLFPPGRFRFNQFPLFPFNTNPNAGYGKHYTLRGSQHGMYPAGVYPVNPGTMGTILDIRADGMSGPPYAGEYAVVKGGDLIWSRNSGTVTVAAMNAHINAPLNQAAVSIGGATLTLPTAGPDEWWTLYVDASANYFAIRHSANPNLYWPLSGGTGFTALNTAATAGLASNPNTTKPNTVKLGSFLMGGGKLQAFIDERSRFGMLNARGEQVIGLTGLTIGNFSGVYTSDIPVIQATSGAIDIDDIGVYGMIPATDLSGAVNTGIVVGGTGGPYSTSGSETLTAYSIAGGYASKIMRVTGQNVKKVVHLRSNADDVFVDKIYGGPQSGGPGQPVVSYEGSLQCPGFGGIIRDTIVEGSHYAYGVQLGENVAGADVDGVVIQDPDNGVIAAPVFPGGTSVTVSTNSLPQWLMGWKGQQLIFDPGQSSEEIVLADVTPFTGAAIGTGVLLTNPTANGVNQATTTSTPTQAALMTPGSWYLIGNGVAPQEMNQLASVVGSTVNWANPLRNTYTGVTVTQFPFTIPLVGSTVHNSHAVPVGTVYTVSRTIAAVRLNAASYPTNHTIMGIVPNQGVLGVDEHQSAWTPGNLSLNPPNIGNLRQDTIFYPGQVNARPDGLIEAKRGVTAYPVTGAPNDSYYPSGPAAIGALAVRTDTQQLWVKTAAGVWVVVGGMGAGYAPATSPAIYTPAGWDAAWRTALANRLNAPAKVLLIGDSIAAGQIAPRTAQQFDEILASTLRTQYGTWGDYYSNMAIWDQSGPPYSLWGPLTGGGVFTGFGWHIMTMSTTLAGSLQGFTTQYASTTLDILYVDSIAGTWQYQIDGGAWQTVTNTGGGTPASTSIKRISLTGLPNAIHALNWGNQSAANVAMLAGVATYSGQSGGIGFARMVGMGWALNNLRDPNTPNNRLSLFSNKSPQNDATPIGAGTFGFPLGPHLAILELFANDVASDGGTNSVASFIETYAVLIQMLRVAQPGCSILFLIPAYPNANWTDNSTGFANQMLAQSYVHAILALAAEYSCAVLDIGPRWGPTPVARGYQQAGNIHPIAAGHASIANEVLALIR